jgi:hypothetical protein
MTPADPNLIKFYFLSSFFKYCFKCQLKYHTTMRENNLFRSSSLGAILALVQGCQFITVNLFKNVWMGKETTDIVIITKEM